MSQGKDSIDLEHVRKHVINQPLDFLSLERYTFDGLSVASDDEVEKIRALPEYLFFDIKRYKSAFEHLVTSLYQDYTITSLGREIQLALEFYTEPHEIPEALHEIVVERIKDYSKDNALLNSLFAVRSLSKEPYMDVVSVITLMLEDLIAALVALKTPVWNDIGCIYEFDSITGDNIVLKKCIEISRF